VRDEVGGHFHAGPRCRRMKNDMPSTRSHADILKEILIGQLSLFKELHDLLELETAQLAAMNVHAMQESNEVKMVLLAQIDTFNSKLRNTFLINRGGQDSSAGTSLGELIASLSTRHKELGHLYQQNKNMASSVQKVATVNGAISERFIKTLRKAQAFLARNTQTSNMYGATGRFTQRAFTPTMINRKA